MQSSDLNWTRYERLVREKAADSIAATTIARAMRQARLSQSMGTERETTIWETATNVIGPFVFSFVKWIMDKAREKDLSTLYFVSRDGQILHKVASELEKSLNYKMRLEYIYGSRKAWHLPGFVKMDETALSWILDSGFCSASEVCRRADIQISDIQSILDTLGISNFERNLTPSERHNLGHMLVNSSEVEGKIGDRAEKLRKCTVNYLRQVGFSRHCRIGVVDIGWRGMLQRSLCQILDRGGIYPEEGMATFYVSLMNECPTFEKESRYTFFDMKEFKDILNPLLFEIFTAADHGTCTGYKETDGNAVAPVLKEERNAPMIEWGVGIQQAGITAFANALITELSNGREFLPIEMKEPVTRILKTFSRKPSEEEAEAYGSVNFYDDQEERSVFKTATKIGRLDALRYLFAHDTSGKYGLWPEGTFRLSFGKRFSSYSLLLNLRHLIEAPLKHWHS